MKIFFRFDIKVQPIVRYQPPDVSMDFFLSIFVYSIETDTERALKIIKNIHNYSIFTYEFHIYENSIKHSGVFSPLPSKHEKIIMQKSIYGKNNIFYVPHSRSRVVHQTLNLHNVKKSCN